MKKQKDFYRLKVWIAFILLFACGSMVGIGIANWGHSIKSKKIVKEEVVEVSASVQKPCKAVESVLLNRLHNNDGNCDTDNRDLETLQKLVSYGCPENRDKFIQMANNKQAVLDVACAGYISDDAEVFSGIETTCGKIEESLKARMPRVYADSNAEEHIERAKIYAMMAEKGCRENSQKNTDLAKQELDIARAIQDDKFDENETIEVVETYKRLKMQQDAEEIFNKAKKLTNPAIDFIMQVEKIINE